MEVAPLNVAIIGGSLGGLAAANVFVAGEWCVVWLWVWLWGVAVNRKRALYEKRYF